MTLVLRQHERMVVTAGNLCEFELCKYAYCLETPLIQTVVVHYVRNPAQDSRPTDKDAASLGHRNRVGVSRSDLNREVVTS